MIVIFNEQYTSNLKDKNNIKSLNKNIDFYKNNVIIICKPIIYSFKEEINMKKSNILKMVVSMSLSVFLIFIGMTNVNAKTTRTETLDLTNQNTEDKLDEEGWAWNNETKTLTLKDANFEITDTDTKNPCIKFSESDNITVIFEGTNNLTADKESVFDGIGEKNGSLTFQSTNNGILNLKIKTYHTQDGGNCGNAINYPYNLNIKSGTINSNGGFLVDGVVSISGGNLNIDSRNFPKNKGIYALRQVNITGGNIDVKSSGSAIMVTGTSGENDYPDGIIISGGNINLTATDARNPSIYAGTLQHKNIIINGGNITLNSDFGIYTAKGVISVNDFDSFNVDNVSLDVFKIGEVEGNEIKIQNADYSKVDEAINKAKKLNKNDYVDFSAVEKAIASVVRGKTILDQSEVDAMGDAINNAIASLKLKAKDIKDDTPKTGIENEYSVIPTIVTIVFLAGFILLNVKNYYKRNKLKEDNN